MKFTWLFFDADDTLFDYPRAEREALFSAFQELDLPAVPELLPVYQKINQQLWRQFEQGLINPVELREIRFTRVLDHFGMRADIQELSRRYLANLAKGAYLIEGAQEMLSVLKGRFRMGLITNGLPEVQRPRLARSTIADYFSFMAISEEIGAAKPDPRYFQAALRLAGNPDPGTVLVIGDNPGSDIRGGAQSNLATLWYNPGGLEADPRWPATFQVRTLSQIPPLLMLYSSLSERQ